MEDAEEVIAQCIKDYFLDNHEGDVGTWDGFTTPWVDTGSFDALALAENIVERLKQNKFVLLDYPDVP